MAKEPHDYWTFDAVVRNRRLRFQRKRHYAAALDAVAAVSPEYRPWVRLCRLTIH